MITSWKSDRCRCAAADRLRQSESHLQKITDSDAGSVVFGYAMNVVCAGVVLWWRCRKKKHFLLPASFKLIVLRCVLCVSIFTQASEIRNERKQLHSDRFWFHIETECGHYFVCVNLNFNFARMKLTLFARLGCSSFGSLFRIEHWLWYTHVYIPNQIHTVFIAIRHLPFTTFDFIGFVHRK